MSGKSNSELQVFVDPVVAVSPRMSAWLANRMDRMEKIIATVTDLEDSILADIRGQKLDMQTRIALYEMFSENVAEFYETVRKIANTQLLTKLQANEMSNYMQALSPAKRKEFNLIRDALEGKKRILILEPDDVVQLVDERKWLILDESGTILEIEPSEVEFATHDYISTTVEESVVGEAADSTIIDCGL